MLNLFEMKWQYFNVKIPIVGKEIEGLAWFIHLTDLHISKFYAADRTTQLKQLGKSEYLLLFYYGQH